MQIENDRVEIAPILECKHSINYRERGTSAIDTVRSTKTIQQSASRFYCNSPFHILSIPHLVVFTFCHIVHLFLLLSASEREIFKWDKRFTECSNDFTSNNSLRSVRNIPLRYRVDKVDGQLILIFSLFPIQLGLFSYRNSLRMEFFFFEFFKEFLL